MENKDALDALSDIRKIMVRSTKFTSLSGIAAIMIGLYAIITAAVIFAFFGIIDNGTPKFLINTPSKLYIIIAVAATLLLLSLLTTFYLAYRKSNKKLILDAPLKRLLWSFALPMLAGGTLCTSMLIYGHYGLTSTIMLTFYGIALVNASEHTYSNVKYLGYAQIILGLADSFTPGYAIIFWVLGFGLLHIIYGIVFYYKYDKSVR